MYIGLGVLGSNIHLEGQEVILKTVLLFTSAPQRFTVPGQTRESRFQFSTSPAPG